jgi:hypothetical protein
MEKPGNQLCVMILAAELRSSAVGDHGYNCCAATDN